MKTHRPWQGAGPHAHSEPGPIVHLTPEDAGWTFTGLQVLRIAPGERRTVSTGESEAFVLPLAGSVQIEILGEPAGQVGSCELQGRESVFTRVTDFLYVGRDTTIVVASERGAEVAVPSARCSQRRPARYGPAEDVPVEVRGAGPSTRQVNNFGVPGVWEHAEKLICCELITPPGNWSSYPPHKHDASEPCPVVNEEIYYYRIAGSDQVTPSREGFGMHRTYTGTEHDEAGLQRLDESIEVRDHDVVLVPHGYHGPCVAAPGYPMYYLNVMAGPSDSREMAFCDDPAHSWVRDSWDGMPSDQRCPMTSAHGPVTSEEDRG